MEEEKKEVVASTEETKPVEEAFVAKDVSVSEMNENEAYP